MLILIKELVLIITILSIFIICWILQDQLTLHEALGVSSVKWRLDIRILNRMGISLSISNLLIMVVKYIMTLNIVISLKLLLFLEVILAYKRVWNVVIV